MPRLEKFTSLVNYLFLIALSLIPSSWSKVCGDVIVFDSYNSPLSGSFSSSNRELGNTIQLAGTERLITEFGLLVSSQNQLATADFKVRFYANDGIGGQPGTLLGETPVLSNITISGSTRGISWSGLAINVPDTFTWTLQDFNATILVGMPDITGNSSIGSILGTWAGNTNNGWTQTPVVPYAAYVVAVPEPPVGKFLLVSFFIAACLILNRRLQFFQKLKFA